MSAGQSERIAGIAPGQRAPDFLLPNPEGKFGRFYDRFTGNLVVLFFYPSNADEEAAREILGFVERAEAFEATGARVVAVTRDGAEANAALKAAHGIDFTLFSDPAGAITRGYGGGAPAALPWANAAARRGVGCTTYLLDRNQRVLAAFHGGDAHAARALAYLETEAPAPAPARLIATQAPVLLLPNVVDAAFCTRIIEAWRADHEEGAVRRRAGASGEAEGDTRTKVVDYRLKKRLDHRPDDALNRDLTEVVVSRIGPEAYKAFQFRVIAVERFCIAAYEAGRGDYFKPHRDNTTKQTENRRFAVTLNLNDDYQGGGVKFAEFSEDIYRTAAGGALMFSCSLMHEALPVTEGTRFAALSFMFGPGDVPGATPGPGA
jgi:peroxiredoxin/predicted 2-oxoglutarate/Fe(II)-dependent dioxygenase YbiX